MAVDRVRVRFPGGVIPRRKDAGSGQTDSPLSNLCRNMFYEAVFFKRFVRGPGSEKLEGSIVDAGPHEDEKDNEQQPNFSGRSTSNPGPLSAA